MHLPPQGLISVLWCLLLCQVEHRLFSVPQVSNETDDHGIRGHGASRGTYSNFSSSVLYSSDVDLPAFFPYTTSFQDKDWVHKMRGNILKDDAGVQPDGKQVVPRPR